MLVELVQQITWFKSIAQSYKYGAVAVVDYIHLINYDLDVNGKKFSFTKQS